MHHKSILFLILFISISVNSLAQQHKIDSLAKQLAIEMSYWSDSVRTVTKSYNQTYKSLEDGQQRKLLLAERKEAIDQVKYHQELAKIPFLEEIKVIKRAQRYAVTSQPYYALKIVGNSLFYTGIPITSAGIFSLVPLYALIRRSENGTSNSTESENILAAGIICTAVGTSFMVVGRILKNKYTHALQETSKVKVGLSPIFIPNAKVQMGLNMQWYF